MRFLAIAWLVFVFVINCSYDCNLRAYVLVTEYEPTVNTARDIVEMDRELWIFNGTGIPGNLKASRIEDYNMLYTHVSKLSAHAVP